MPDEMEVTSFPGFDRSIFEDAIAGRTIRARGYRNRRIGDFLKEHGYLAVHIRVHPSFKRTDAAAERMRAYEQRVLAALDPRGCP